MITDEGDPTDRESSPRLELLELEVPLPDRSDSRAGTLIAASTLSPCAAGAVIKRVPGNVVGKIV